METSKNADVIVDNDSSIVEECEDLIACETAHPVPSGFLASNVRGIMERMASHPWGQMIFKSADRVLWCIERTLIWQNPEKVSLVPMDRPVNVFLAYPLAAFLWILQYLMFSTAETSSAIELIKWVQTRRRRLRAIRFHGIRNMRGKTDLAGDETVSRFYRVFWFLAETPSDSNLKIDTVEKDNDKEETIESDIEDSEHNKKRRFSALSVSTDDKTIFLDDDYDSENDSDYVPQCSADSSDTSDSDMSSVEEGEIEDCNPNNSVRDDESTEKTVSPQKSTNGDHTMPKE